MVLSEVEREITKDVVQTFLRENKPSPRKTLARTFKSSQSLLTLWSPAYEIQPELFSIAEHIVEIGDRLGRFHRAFCSSRRSTATCDYSDRLRGRKLHQ